MAAPPGLASGALAFGLNEAVSIPRAWLEKRVLLPREEPGELARDAALVRELGATIVRANSPTYPFLNQHHFDQRGGSWRMSDHWVQAMQDARLDALVVIGPWPGNRTAAYTESYLPADWAAYEAWVQAVVERYDGDGVDDMPGLSRPVKHWEIDNEPDLHNSVPPRGAAQRVDPEDFQTPAEYAQVLVRSAAAIRAADPEATVLSAGMYRPATRPGRAYLEAVLAEPGALEAFDVLSLHCYFDGDELDRVDRTLETARELAPGKRVWITETGVPSEGDGAHIDEAWQGRMVAAVYGAFLAGGAERVFWHTLADPPSHNRHARSSPFSTHSLFRTVSDPSTDPRGTGRHAQRELKPAGAVYQRLASALAPARRLEDQRVGSARLLRTETGALLYEGRLSTLEPGRVATSLLTGETVPAGASVAAPAWIPAGGTPPGAAGL